MQGVARVEVQNGTESGPIWVVIGKWVENEVRDGPGSLLKALAGSLAEVDPWLGSLVQVVALASFLTEDLVGIWVGSFLEVVSWAWVGKNHSLV